MFIARSKVRYRVQETANSVVTSHDGVSTRVKMHDRDDHEQAANNSIIALFKYLEKPWIDLRRIARSKSIFLVASSPVCLSFSRNESLNLPTRHIFFLKKPILYARP
jgi:hypothetical protein